MMSARNVRQILGAIFFGALIGATLMAIAIIRSPHSHASPGDISTVEGVAYHVCMDLSQNPTEQNLVSIVNALYDAGNTDAQEHAVMHYAMNVACPQYQYIAVLAAIDVINGKLYMHHGSESLV